jgi:hypothetical protein
MCVKRGCDSHPKTLAFAAALRIPLPYACGLLELLWHLTARLAPRGDIGRLTNQQIAAGIHWAGDPERLIKALLEARLSGDGAGFIAVSPELRLVVHDWHEHADPTTRRYLERKGLSFLGNSKSVSRQVTDNGATLSRQVPDIALTCLALPIPIPIPTPPTPKAGEGEGTPGEGESESQKELAALHEQPELRGLTLEQWLNAKRAHPIPITEQVLERIRSAAALAGYVKGPGFFAAAILSKVELAKAGEKKDRPRKKRWFKPEEK